MSKADFITAPAGSKTLEDSHRYCRKVTRESARNFYYGLKLLPEPKRSAMFAIYAYMRQVDDIADDAESGSLHQRITRLEDWRRRTHAALRGDGAEGGNDGIWPAFEEVGMRVALPASLFDEMIAGQLQDMNPIAFETFAELEKYCYRVAGVVGLVSLRIWGYEGGAATEELAIARGVAFQLTNILRDLKEDAGRGRLYLPREELAAHGLTPEELVNGEGGELFDRFMRFQIERAESFYEKSVALEMRIEPDSRATLHAMTEIYHGLLKKMAADPRRVLRERISLSLLHKLRIGWRATRGAGGHGAMGGGDGSGADRSSDRRAGGL